MAITMYHGSVPVFLQLLERVERRARQVREARDRKKWDAATVLNERLYPDMFPLARQVRQASVHALGAATVAGVNPPQLPDIDTSFAEMQSRIDKTIDFLKSLRRPSSTAKKIRP